MTQRIGVCFDAHGTLIELAEPVGEVYHRIARQYEVDLPAWRLGDAFERVIARSGPPRAEGPDPETRRQAEIDGWFDLIRQVFQATDSTARFPDFTAFAQALFRHYGTAAAWRIRGDAAALQDCLAALRSAGHPVGVLSNFDHRLHDLLKALDIKEIFDAIVTPSGAGTKKPDRAMFLYFANRLGCRLEELIYIGDDSPEDAEEIASLGVRTLSVDPVRESAPDWKQLRRQIQALATVQRT